MFFNTFLLLATSVKKNKGISYKFKLFLFVSALLSYELAFFLDPALADITNKIPITTPSHEATITGHNILREVARRDLQIYTNKMANQMNKGKK